jgi:predicted ATPase
MRTPPLVGRELDLAVALEQLKRLEAGRPSSLLIRGEAGIGKSRLVAEVVQRAKQVGHTALVGRADDLDAGIPYALFLDLLARLGDVSDAPSGLGEQVDAFRATVESRAAASVDDDAHLAAVFSSAVRLFRTIAAASPTLLVLEDLHAADRDARMLVGPLTRLADVPMLIVVTLRPGPEADLERLLERQAFDGRGAVIDLDTLDRSDTQALVTAALGAVADDHLVDAV